jgi:hypothetical protein
LVQLSPLCLRSLTSKCQTTSYHIARLDKSTRTRTRTSPMRVLALIQLTTELVAWRPNTPPSSTYTTRTFHLSKEHTAHLPPLKNRHNTTRPILQPVTSLHSQLPTRTLRNTLQLTSLQTPSSNTLTSHSNKLIPHLTSTQNHADKISYTI